MKLLHRLPLRSLTRWWIVGLIFFVGGLGLLALLRDVLKVPLIIGTVIAAELTIILRFGINDRWVFGHQRPTLMRLWQFHLASAGGGAIWWVVANVLPRFGVHYLIASAAGTACSVFLSMFTNFAWIWHRGRTQPGPRQNTSYFPVQDSSESEKHVR